MIKNIRHIIFISGLAILSVGCGKAQVLELGQFSPYVQSFVNESSGNGHSLEVNDLIIRFGAMRSKFERANCSITEGQTPVITVNETTWNQINEYDRESMMFHELGHCVLLREHRADVDNSGIPVSMMNPYALNSYVYEARRNNYVKELFGSK
jgi:hypothetical protein